VTDGSDNRSRLSIKELKELNSLIDVASQGRIILQTIIIGIGLDSNTQESLQSICKSGGA
jgi:hypothetical protein